MHDVKINHTLPAIKWNFEDLKAWAHSITEQYDNLVISEDDVTAIKEEMAGLNHLKDRLETARKEAVRQVSAPIKEFESQIKEVVEIFTTTRAALNEQVQAHVQRERESKRVEVQLIIDDQKSEYGVKELEIPVQESWLNKTTTLKSVTAQVGNIILRHLKEQADIAALEQAKKDRIVAIESHSKSVGATHGLTISFARFAHLQDLGVSLQDAMRSIDAAYADEVARVESSKFVQPAPEPPAPVPHFMDPPALPPEPPAPEVKSMVITATYKATSGQAITELYRKLKGLCIKCSASVRES